MQTATERHLHAKAIAHKSWALTENRSARTLSARLKAMERFEREADPSGELLPAERARRAESLRKAHFADLARKSVKARRQRAEATHRPRFPTSALTPP